MTTVPVHAAKTDLSRLIDLALNGEDVVIACNGRPLVRLVAIDAPFPRRRCGSLNGQIEVPDSFFDPLPEEELRLWEGG